MEKLLLKTIKCLVLPIKEFKVDLSKQIIIDLVDHLKTICLGLTTTIPEEI